jgi:hypothetical protein
MTTLDFPKAWFPSRTRRVQLAFPTRVQEVLDKAELRYRHSEFPDTLSFLNHFLVIANMVKGFADAIRKEDVGLVRLVLEDAVVEFNRCQEVPAGTAVLAYALPQECRRQVILERDADGLEVFPAALAGNLGLLITELSRLMEIIHWLRHYKNYQ